MLALSANQTYGNQEFPGVVNQYFNEELEFDLNCVFKCAKILAHRHVNTLYSFSSLRIKSESALIALRHVRCASLSGTPHMFIAACKHLNRNTSFS